MKKALLLSTILTFGSVALDAKADEDTITIQQGLASFGLYWKEGRELPVCFRYTGFTPANNAAPTNATAAANMRARFEASIERTIERAVDLEFTGFATCPSSLDTYKGIYVNVHPGDIRESANTGGLGTDKKRARVSVDTTTSDQTIVHEVMHALGFVHEQLRDDNRGWCLSGTVAQFGQVEKLTKEYDDLSITNYCRPDREDNEDLSPLDIRGLQKVYGVPKSQRLGANETGDRFGSAIAVGDWTGDGVPDFAAGAWSEAIGRNAAAGAVFAFDGNRVGALQHAKTLTQKGLGSDEAGDHMGWNIVFADLDGDGKDELIAAAPREKLGNDPAPRGALFVWREENGQLAPWFSKSFANSGITLLGQNAMSAGDLDGDGRDELAVTMTRAGQTRVMVMKRSGQDMAVIAEYAVTGGAETTAMQIADVRGDAKAELIIGVPRGRVSNGRDAGFVEVLELRGNLLRQVQRIQQTDGASPEAGDGFGSALAVGDINGDGRNDLVVAAIFEAIGSVANSGHVSVYQGTGSALQLQGHYHQGTLGAGSAEVDDFMGSSLAIGDFNGDGFGDIAIGSSGETALDRSDNPGYVWVSLGGADFVQKKRGFWMSQSPIDDHAATDRFGDNLAVADLDGDGADELIVSVENDTTANGASAGSVIVYRTPYRPLEAWYSFDQRDRF